MAVVSVGQTEDLYLRQVFEKAANGAPTDPIQGFDEIFELIKEAIRVKCTDLRTER